MPLTASRGRAERAEARWIEQLACDFEPLEVRAAALRYVAELRGLSVRTVAAFFEVEPRIVVLALSLLPVATPASVPVKRIAPLSALVRAA